MIPRAITGILVAALLISGPVPSGAQAISLVPLASGLASALSVAHAGDGSGRLFIVLQTGQILIYNGGRVLARPFLDISNLVSCCGERGLLGLAFHPAYASNGSFYVNYTDRRGNTVVARYSVSRLSPNLANPRSATTLLTVDQPYANHNGGQLQFGPDGYLYIGLGDGGSAGDPQNNAQNLGTLLGKILRVDVDGGSPYAIPPDNPFVGVEGARPEIWAYGLRNPWRFSFDRLTGDIFIGDVGQDEWEEINFQPASSAGGENYGWRLMEGGDCYDPPTGCNPEGLVLPILEYDHSQGCAVIGGFRYRGAQVPTLSGQYLYADYCSGLMWGAAQDDAGTWSTGVLLDAPFSVSSFGEGPDGELYVLSYGSSGTLYKISTAP
ncbi:MAG: PQQ-dependent sugar dehydrogenase [candidate division NC10 bacterium]